ncbi:hypothetical protein B0I35DRAFT_475036 [Stachybotrys elegans]|uniref:Uncharacterized protein n=1 Tax=Stachybotrys elegans TaxID=80388 RepID=A0A8K0T4L0_9HYPO|nr:hypothetical protein B0I35DRAFT_475036 [Stachybotrys elegans]
MPLEPFPVIAHPYRSPTPFSCAYEVGPTSASKAIVFIGGLGDGPHTVPYVRSLAKRLVEASEVGYSIFEIRMRSSFIGFGTSSLANDVEDISALVDYLRGIGKKTIVLFGHSTGCQDCMEYSNYAKYQNSPVDGFILQAPVSDREGLAVSFPKYQESLDLANKMIADGHGEDCLPKKYVHGMLGAPVSAYRVQSLCAKGGDDDYFSSDLDDETVVKFWSRFEKPVLVLHSEEDEHVPKHVNQEELNKRYQKAGKHVSSLSGIIPGTGHTVRGQEARDWLADRVIQFLGTL